MRPLFPKEQTLPYKWRAGSARSGAQSGRRDHPMRLVPAPLPHLTDRRQIRRAPPQFDEFTSEAVRGAPGLA